jgi:threonine dehydrogenase-like Zn-dependent dehydrogenase
MKAKAMVQTGDRRLDLREIEIPVIASDEALLRVEACGLCGSDIDQYRGGTAASGLVCYPMIPGHEPVGVIEHVGAQAAASWGVRAGDRVAVEPHLSCGACPQCLGGRYHLCRRLRPHGIPGYGFLPLEPHGGLTGGYATHMHLKARTIVHRLPPSLPLKLATLYQAIAGGVRWAVTLPQTAMGDTVLIFGCGQRGLGAVIACREAGVGRILITGLARDRHKLELARALGADETIVADEEDTVARVMDLTHGQGVDVAVDLAPFSPQTVAQAIDVVRSGGTVVLAGLKGRHQSPAIDTDKVVFKEITLRGAFSQGWQAYEQALRILHEDRYGLARLRTHDFALEDADAALRLLSGETPGEDGICLALHP